MSQFAAIRQDFFRQIAVNGWQQPEDVTGNWPVPIERWLGRYYRPAVFQLSRQRRLVNHFLVGADPELVFETRDGFNEPGRVDANTMHLKAGLAWGADNNGRLVELRPKPDRFALATLASMWSTLKWLSLLNPKTLEFRWRAGAYFMQDGLGGHIHFGRKRPTRQRETAALDTLSFFMFASGIWDKDEGRERIRHAQGGGNHGYGRLGDLREQPYGYEYRTMPSWLCSPWMAYLSLVLAKLAVHDPNLFPLLHPDLEKLTPQQIRSRLLAILGFYKGLDDDASLAFAIQQKQGWPEWHVNDLKPAWGILGGAKIALPKVDVEVQPAMVPPLEAEISALATALLSGQPPEIVSLEPSWSPSKLPEGYKPLLNNVNTHHAPGIGEIAVGLCTHRGVNEVYLVCHQGGEIYVPGNWGWDAERQGYQLHPRYRELWRKQFPELVSKTYVDMEERKHIHPQFSFGARFREAGARRQMIDFLTCGCFPVWKIEDVKPDSYELWKKEWLLKPGDKVEPEFKFSKPVPPAAGLKPPVVVDKPPVVQQNNVAFNLDIMERQVNAIFRNRNVPGVG
jgi:hypothetical protein